MHFPFLKILLHFSYSDSHDSDTSAGKGKRHLFGVCLYCSAEPQNHEGNTWPSVHVLMGIILMYCMVRSSLLPSRRQLFLIVRLLRNIKWNNVHLALLKSFIEHNDKVF